MGKALSRVTAGDGEKVEIMYVYDPHGKYSMFDSSMPDCLGQLDPESWDKFIRHLTEKTKDYPSSYRVKFQVVMVAGWIVSIIICSIFGGRHPIVGVILVIWVLLHWFILVCNMINIQKKVSEVDGNIKAVIEAFQHEIIKLNVVVTFQVVGPKQEYGRRIQFKFVNPT